MSIHVGGIDLAGGLIDTQYRLAVLEQVVEHLLGRMPTSISQTDIKRFQDKALADLQKKYPEAGIKRN